MNQPLPFMPLAGPTARLLAALALLATLSACSMGQIVVRTSSAMLDGGVEAMNRETDLGIAEAAIPANLKLLEGMIMEDPGNPLLHLYAAQALYGYAFGFVEQQEPRRAGELYLRAMQHGVDALRSRGLREDITTMRAEALGERVARLGKGAVPALFWTASCWAKWVDMNRDNPDGIAQMANAAALMQRVLELDENYYHGGPHIFFGVYFGARPPMLGGDYARSASHFDKARASTGGRLLITDVLQAEFLSRQQLDEADFVRRLTSATQAEPGLYPEMALANQVARKRAAWLLEKTGEWF